MVAGMLAEFVHEAILNSLPPYGTAVLRTMLVRAT